MVRDDFWMAATRFMSDLEIDLVRSENIAARRSLRPAHARKVLTAFGRPTGLAREAVASWTREQESFLDQAVAGLAQDGKVISVRLALFAEMVKGKPWTPATLREVGGTEGVGVTFLEETFSSPQANPKHRLHQKAAQAVLKALLPETRHRHQGPDAVGGGAARGLGLRRPAPRLRRPDPHPRPRAAPDHADRPRGLDRRGRIRPGPDGERYYQLTHDYLVHSLRDWLTRKQRETRRGRAELRLAERAALWNAKPENRHLPSVLEWANIRLLTRRKDWTEPQRRMMRRAGRVHGLRGLGLAILIALVTWGGIEGYGTLRAAALVESLKTANTTDVPASIEQLRSYRRWAGRPLAGLLASTRERPRSASPRQPGPPRLVARRPTAGRLSLRPSPGGLARRAAGDLGHPAEARAGDRTAVMALAGRCQSRQGATLSRGLCPGQRRFRPDREPLGQRLFVHHRPIPHGRDQESR